ncbi:DUF2306 domain-containing protein [Oricola sp.]|uniref:DUF2306 domain-containing protein n=1 Tax=Oricola sp. TaxID=1979950 RepID=UPI003BA8BE0E
MITFAESNRLRAVLAAALAAAVIVLAWPFARHAYNFGLQGLNGYVAGWTHLHSAGRPLANTAIFAHMVAGAFITIAAPLQLMPPLRNRFPALHRWTGRAICLVAIVTALGGLFYIVTRHTIGGPVMDTGFALYGLLMLVSAVETARHARAGDFARHRRWALRLFFLSIGSWLYRVHYAVWYGLTGGLGTAPGFSGPFDLIQTFAFYVPYLLVLEIIFAFERRRAGTMAAGQAAE